MSEYGDTVILSVPARMDPAHKGKFVWKDKPVDRCIAPIVQALNDGGVFTESCCCGHGRGAGYIVLRDGRVLRVAEFGSEFDVGGAV